MKGFLRHFFFEVKEWFADVVDHFKLWVKDTRIYLLNQKLEDLKEDWNFGWEIDPEEIQIIIEELDFFSKQYNEILARIRARKARHQLREVAH
jgi:hypothetical protein